MLKKNAKLVVTVTNVMVTVFIAICSNLGILRIIIAKNGFTLKLMLLNNQFLNLVKVIKLNVMIAALMVILMLSALNVGLKGSGLDSKENRVLRTVECLNCKSRYLTIDVPIILNGKVIRNSRCPICNMYCEYEVLNDD